MSCTTYSSKDRLLEWITLHSVVGTIWRQPIQNEFRSNMYFQVEEADEIFSRKQLDSAAELSRYRVDIATRDKDLAAEYSRKLADFKEEAENMRKAEILAVEDAKNVHVQVNFVI